MIDFGRYIIAPANITIAITQIVLIVPMLAINQKPAKNVPNMLPAAPSAYITPTVVPLVWSDSRAVLTATGTMAPMSNVGMKNEIDICARILTMRLKRHKKDHSLITLFKAIAAIQLSEQPIKSHPIARCGRKRSAILPPT